MKMFSKQKAILMMAAGALVTAWTMATTAPANAATLDVNFEGNGFTFLIVQANQEIYCPQFDHAGTFDDISNTGALNDLTASGCTNPIIGATTVTPNGTWNFAVGSNVGGTVWDADITNVWAFVSYAGCSFNLAGSVDGTFDTSSQTFEMETFNLKISSVPQGFMCPIVGIEQGQDLEIDGTWTNTGDTITLP